MNIRDGLAGMFSGVGRALSQKNYRFYAMGHIAHVHGWWGNRMGIGWLTWQLTESATWLGIMTMASMIPVTVISPIAGAIADRYGQRRTAMAAALCGSAITWVMCGLVITGHISLPVLVGLTILQGTVFGLEFPSRQALIPQLVGRANIPAAIAFNSTSFNVGTFIGPVIAGFLISKFNPGAAVMLYACTTLWMAFMLYNIDVESPVRGGTSAIAALIGDIREGFRYAGEERGLILLFLITFTQGFFLRSYADLLPGFADTVFGRGAQGLGWLNGSAGVGALFISVWMMIRSRTVGLVRLMIISGLITGLSLIGFALTPVFNFALPILAVVAGSLLAAQVASYSLIQTISRNDMRARVISINVSLIMGGPALGVFAIGSLADRIGLSAAEMCAGTAAVVLILAMAPGLMRRRADIEADRSQT